MRSLKSRIVSEFNKYIYFDAKHNGRVLHSILDIIIINFQPSSDLLLARNSDFLPIPNTDLKGPIK